MINVDDPLAASLHNVADVEEHCPGVVSGVREWFRWYKTPDDKPINAFGAPPYSFPFLLVRSGCSALLWQRLGEGLPCLSGAGAGACARLLLAPVLRLLPVLVPLLLPLQLRLQHL